MAIKELTLENLMELDGGKVAAAFNQALKRIVMDCEDRPGDKKERGVKLALSIKPLLNEHGELEDVIGQFFIDDSIPKRKTRAYTFGFRKGGKLAFSTASPDINQKAFEEFEEGD